MAQKACLWTEGKGEQKGGLGIEGLSMSAHCIDERQYLNRVLKERWSLGAGKRLEKAFITDKVTYYVWM